MTSPRSLPFHRLSLAALVAGLVPLLAPGHAAHAAEPERGAGETAPPLRHREHDATPLRTLVPPPPRPTTELPPDPPGDTPPTEVPAEPAPATDESRDRDVLVATGRWITVPDAVLGLFYDTFQPLSQPGFGLAFETGAVDDRVWSLELGWAPLTPRPGNWLSRGAAPTTADYIESSLHMLSFDVTYRRQFQIGDVFRAMLGAGLGVAYLVGNVSADDVLPDCAEPVAACGHWPRATRRNLSLPTRVLPVLHLMAGLEIDLGDAMVFRLSAGLKNTTYLGASLGVRL